MEIGDIVVRKSYNKDIRFKIVDIKRIDDDIIFILKGRSIRIIADAPENDLEKIDDENNTDDLLNISNSKIKRFSKVDRVSTYKNEISCNKYDRRGNFKKKGLRFGKSGRLLHVDGDFEYLVKCVDLYEQLNVNVYGEFIEESRQPEVILDLVKFYNPDIVVLTGHDSMNKNVYDYMDLNFYKNSRYFLESVKKLRNYDKNLDNLVIFAGACQSCYELLIEAGANFATSPKRVLVHCLDPVFVCSKVFNTSIDKTVKLDEILDETITGFNGIGGVQTRGKYREGFPKSFYV